MNESIINDNTTHDPEDYEAIHDHLADEDDIYNESYIISKKNYEINMDKWKPGTPLWITGSSGDGKSTYANQLAKEKKAFLVPLDLFLVRIAKPKEKYDKFLNDTSGTVISNGSQMVLEYINKHPEIPWADNVKGNWGTSGQDPELWNGLFDWLIDASAKNPKYKTKLIIFEGCNICLMPVEKAVKFPFIIMGTSRLQSSIRRIKRDKKEHDDYSIFKLVYRELKRSTKGVLPSLNKTKDNFEKGLKKQMKTINESHECLIMDNEEFFEETYKPFDEYLKLNHYDPKTGTIDASNEYHYGQRKSKIDKRRPISMPRSKKQWNRINKFLRENDYDPKTETIRTDVVDPKTGKKRRIKFNITDNFFNMKNRKTHAYFRYNDELENPERDGERDLSINMQPRTMGVKPRYSNFSLKHEEGHYDDYLAQLFNTEHLNEIRAIKQMALDFDAEEDAAGNYDKLTDKDTHDRQSREHYADWYGAKHNPYDNSPNGVHLADGFNQTHDEWKRKVVSEKGGNKKNIGELIETLAKSGPANFENNVKDLNLSDKDKAKLRAAVVNYARTKAEDRNLNSQKQLDKEKIHQQDDYKQMKSELRDIEKKLNESIKNKNSEDSEYFKNKYLELEKTFKDTFKPAEQSLEDEYSEKRKQLRDKLEKDIKAFSEELNNKTRKRLENASNKEKHKNAVAMANKRYAPHDQGLEGREKFVNYANEKLKENPNKKINEPVDDWLKFGVKSESSNVLVSNEEFFMESQARREKNLERLGYDPKTETIDTGVINPKTGKTYRIHLELISNNSGGAGFFANKETKDLDEFIDTCGIAIPRSELNQRNNAALATIGHELGHFVTALNKQFGDKALTPEEKQTIENFRKYGKYIISQINNPRDYGPHDTASEEIAADKYAVSKTSPQAFNKMIDKSYEQLKQNPGDEYEYLPWMSKDDIKRAKKDDKRVMNNGAHLRKTAASHFSQDKVDNFDDSDYLSFRNYINSDESGSGMQFRDDSSSGSNYRRETSSDYYRRDTTSDRDRNDSSAIPEDSSSSSYDSPRARRIKERKEKLRQYGTTDTEEIARMKAEEELSKSKEAGKPVQAVSNDKLKSLLANKKKSASVQESCLIMDNEEFFGLMK